MSVRPFENTEIQESRELLGLPTEYCRTSKVNQSTATRNGLAATIFQVLLAADPPLRMGTDVVFEILHTSEAADYPLTSEEACILSPRASKRTRERFTLGRAASHLALQHLGIDQAYPILRGQEGEPLWPAGVTGSISHCDPWTVAVVALASHRFSPGIDLENIPKANRIAISQLICCDGEPDLLKADNCEKHVGLIFSAKEAIYKAIYPLCHRYIGFKEVKMVAHVQEERFEGELLTPINHRLSTGTSFRVQYRCYGDFVFSYVAYAHT